MEDQDIKPDIETLVEIKNEDSTLKTLLMDDREIIYTKTMKQESCELEDMKHIHIKKEEFIDTVDPMEYAVSHEDFQMTNEEIDIKPELNSNENIVGLMTSNSQLSKKKKKRSRDQNELFKCPDCNFQSKHKTSLYKHRSVHHVLLTEDDMHKCPQCPYSTKYKGNLTIHMVIHLDENQIKMHNCEYCDYKTKRKGHLNSHMRIHSKDATVYSCDKCDYKTKHPGCLKKHIVSHQKIDEATTVYQCTYCTHKTKNKTRLVKHERIHFRPLKSADYMCFHCIYQSNNKYMLIKHLKDHRKPKLKCEYCSYETPKADRFKAHQKIHINVK